MTKEQYKERKQEYNRLVPQVRKFRHVTFDIFTDLNVEVIYPTMTQAEKDWFKARIEAFKNAMKGE